MKVKAKYLKAKDIILFNGNYVIVSGAPEPLGKAKAYKVSCLTKESKADVLIMQGNQSVKVFNGEI